MLRSVALRRYVQHSFHCYSVLQKFAEIQPSFMSRLMKFHGGLRQVYGGS